MKLSKEERLNWYRYRIPGQSNLHRVKVNAVFMSVANSKEHEMAKASLAYDLMKMGHKILTEAQIGDRRVDLIDITEGEEYEIETDPRRAKRFEGMDVHVIKLWEENG